MKTYGVKLLNNENLLQEVSLAEDMVYRFSLSMFVNNDQIENLSEADKGVNLKSRVYIAGAPSEMIPKFESLIARINNAEDVSNLKLQLLINEQLIYEILGTKLTTFSCSTELSDEVPTTTITIYEGV